MESEQSRQAIRYRRLGYLALNVTDLDVSERFYRDLVGLQLVDERGPSDERFLRCGIQHHSLMLCKGSSPGVKRIGFEMESPEALDALVEALAKEGVKMQELPATEARAFGLRRCIRMVDPHTTATFDFYDAMREFGGMPYVPTVAKIQRLGHVVLKTPNYREAIDFFVKKLNFQISDEVDGAISFMRCFPNRFHHSLAIGRGKAPALHHINFMVSEVDDIGKAIWRFQKAGVTVVNGPGRHPPSGSMFYYFLDPDELTLEYSFGMEEFPETGARQHRILEAASASFDYWGAPTDHRKAAVGGIEPAN